MSTAQDYMNQLIATLPWIVMIYMIPALIRTVVEAVKEVKK
ncbi:MAG: hypothetical protein ACXQTI_03980 [Candidatus Nezhaarchaeales archaeon]